MLKYACLDGVKSIDDKIEDIASKKLIIKYKATKELVDFDSDIVKVQGIDISRLKKGMPFLWAHEQLKFPLGKILTLEKDREDMDGTSELVNSDIKTDGRHLYELIFGGFVTQVSISFSADWSEVEQKKLKNGKMVNIIHKSVLHEISAVNVGANSGTSISVKNFKAGLEKGWDAGLLNGTQLNNLNEVVDDLKYIEEKMDYEAEIKALKAEMEELKDGRLVTQLFDDYKKEKKVVEESIYEKYIRILGK